MFKKTYSVEHINNIHRNTACEQLGMVFTEVGPDYLRAKMPVDRRTVQPAGILHGGASVALAETMGSLAAIMASGDSETAVGMDVNATHMRAVREGWVHGECRPIHLGRRSQVWQIDIRDDAGRLTCTARLTASIVAN